MRLPTFLVGTLTLFVIASCVSDDAADLNNGPPIPDSASVVTGVERAEDPLGIDGDSGNVLRAVSGVVEGLRFTLFAEPEVVVGNRTSFLLSIEPVRQLSGTFSPHSPTPFSFSVRHDDEEVWRISGGGPAGDEPFRAVTASGVRPLTYQAEWTLVDSNGDPLEPGDYTLSGQFKIIEERSTPRERFVTIESPALLEFTVVAPGD